MVKKNARTSKNIVSFPIVRNLPKGGRFRDRVRAPRSKRSVFGRSLILKIAETLARTGVVKPNPFPMNLIASSKFKVPR